MEIINIHSNKNFITNMSNIFKSNSRFSVLADDLPTIKKENKKENKKELNPQVQTENKEERFNSFKNDYPREDRRKENYFKQYDEKERERQRKEREEKNKAQKEFEERERERLKEESLKSENFPDLVVCPKKDKKKSDKINNISYVEKLKEENDSIMNDKIEPSLENLKPGWLLIKRDSKTGKIITKHGPKTHFFEEKIKSEKELAMDVLNSLVKLHEKRKAEYIELNGYDTWEKMFKFPNWREEEAYLAAMEEMENEYENEEENYDEDDYY